MKKKRKRESRIHIKNEKEINAERKRDKRIMIRDNRIMIRDKWIIIRDKWKW